MGAHLDFLEEHRSEIQSAGPLFSADGAGAGGIWNMTTETADQADALVRADLFWPTGLRETYQIFSWKQVFADGTPQINVS